MICLSYFLGRVCLRGGDGPGASRRGCLALRAENAPMSVSLLRVGRSSSASACEGVYVRDRSGGWLRPTMCSAGTNSTTLRAFTSGTGLGGPKLCLRVSLREREETMDGCFGRGSTTLRWAACGFKEIGIPPEFEKNTGYPYAVSASNLEFLKFFSNLEFLKIWDFPQHVSKTDYLAHPRTGAGSVVM